MPRPRLSFEAIVGPLPARDARALFAGNSEVRRVLRARGLDGCLPPPLRRRPDASLPSGGARGGAGAPHPAPTTRRAGSRLRSSTEGMHDESE